MIDDVKIRLGELSDLPALIKAGDELFDNPINEKSTRAFFKDTNSILVCAFYQEKIIGFASGLVYAHPDKKPNMFINEVSVLEQYHNNKVGRSMVTFLIDHARGKGCTEAWIGTEETNLPAIKAYKAAGGVQDEDKAIILTFNLKE